MSWLGTNNQDNAGSYEMGGGGLIPAGTVALAAPDEVKWDEFQGQRHISVRWVLFAPEQFKGRKVFQKLKVDDPDEKKRDRQRRMLAAVDANAGGKIAALGKEPTDTDLQAALMNKPMLIKLETWSQNGKEGNWIAAVSPRNSGTPSAPPPPAEQPFRPDDDIPF